MTTRDKKLPRVFDYYVEKEQFAGGNTFCAGCPAELTLRTVPKGIGERDYHGGNSLLLSSDLTRAEFGSLA